MPHYFITDFSGRERSVRLETVLQPSCYHDGGSVEQAQAQANANAEAIGRLLAMFVEMKVMDLTTALSVAGVRNDIKVVG